MSVLDTAMLTVMRDALETLLPDTCNILTATRTHDGVSGNIETWGTAYGTVACRLDLIPVQQFEMVKAAEVRPYPRYQLTVPYDTVLTVEDRIEHNSVTYAVVKVNISQSWKAVGRAILELVSP